MKNLSVKTKLAGYSAMAAATLAAADSKAQIIYTDPPDITIDNTPYLLDLNNDGVYDFAFFHAANGYLLLYGNNEYDQILEGSDCNFYLHPPRIIPEGLVIKRTPFDWTPIEMSSSAGFFCAPPGSCDDVPWPGKKMKFFGFRFKDHPIQSNYNYGWMRVSVPNDCHNMKIHDWAYNSVIGASIVAGQTQRTASDELMVPGNDLLVYANAKTLYINNNIEEELLRVSITSLSGQLLREVTTSQESTELDLNSFASGILLVSIRGDHTSHSWKVVVE